MNTFKERDEKIGQNILKEYKNNKDIQNKNIEIN